MITSWLNKVKTFTIGWFISLVLWRILRKFGIKAYLDLFEVEFSTYNILLLVLIISVIAGVIFGSIQFLYEEYFNRKISFRGLLITAISIHVIVMFLVYLFFYIVLRLSGLDSDLLFLDFITSPLLLVNFLYTALVNILIIITIHISKLLGKGNLTKLVTGKFYKPKEELRVFMFLDLKSSTTIAENLGHIKYSSFIQDCFFDLAVVEKYKAEVYQYVGDEVVLTWKIKENDNLNNCLNAYFSYLSYLESKSAYYISKYNTVPFFRAGMHVGLVTAVEVGKIKREIAYHGDTINIASRIQEKCKAFNADFLVSHAVLELVKEASEFEFNIVGKETLRGKKIPTIMYNATKR